MTHKNDVDIRAEKKIKEIQLTDPSYDPQE